MISRSALRAASLLAVVVAGSCSSPSDEPKLTQDPAQNHPITVEPSYRSLKVSYEGSLSVEDSSALAEFVSDYLAHGNGAISITAPQEANSDRVLAALAEQIEGLGVSRDRILVGVRDNAADGRVVLGYISYEARTAPCGDWSVNAADNSDNQVMPNFGCAVQHNIAAQLSDPRDLLQPRGMTPADATRRMQVMSKYEQGQTTQQQKTQDQTGAVSSVGSGQQ